MAYGSEMVAVLFHQCSMFYTAWKMRLSAAHCVYMYWLLGQGRSQKFVLGV